MRCTAFLGFVDPTTERGPCVRWLLAPAALLGFFALACADEVVQPADQAVNRPPSVTVGIAAQTMLVGERVTIDLTAHFNDPDGDALGFGVNGEDPAVATTSAVGGMLTVVAVGQGTTTFVVTATDLGGLSASQAVAVTVLNRPPVLADSISALEMVAGDSAVIDLAAHFDDPDGDALGFAVEASRGGVASASASGNTLTVVAMMADTTTLVVAATDPGGLSASQAVAVTVLNRAPVLADSIPALEMATGDSAVIDLAAHFNDPDGDALGFAVEASRGGAVSASASGDTLTVVALMADTTTLVVAATDPGGLSASQAVAVTVLNRAPVLADSIPALEMVAGDSAVIDLAAHFDDPDGDALGFAVEASRGGAVSASASGDTLTVVALMADTTTLVVAATDPGGLSASQTVAVTVLNRAPVLADSIPALEMATGDSAVIDLAAHFADPDGDALGFAVEASRGGVASASASGDTLTVVAMMADTTTLVVAATDPGGLSASQAVAVTVLNRAPVLADSIPALEMVAGDSAVIDLAAHFDDPDGDALTFVVESSNPEVVTASVSGQTVTVRAEARGTAEVAVTGQDPGKLTASQTFEVVVPNRQPTVTESISRQPLLRGESIAIDLRRHFRDPDGDVLEFTALVSDRAVASASITGPRATIAGLGPGTAEVTVIAEDPGDLSTSQSFVVLVPANADRDALIALYRATDGANWNRRTNWLSRRPLDRWEGVAVDAAGRVSGLRLVSNRLAGPLPPEIGWLTELTELDLANNNLKGAIPAELGQLRALEHLHLDANSLTGAIPAELGDLAALTELRLYNNALTGSIPPELGDLARLTVVVLEGNQLTGPIPAELGNLSQLDHLWLSHNNLSGPIPPQLGRLRSLKELELGGNQLTGSIPVELGRLGSLKRLVLSHNELQGALPPELGRLRSLEELELRDNQLTGSIPPELGQLSRLEDLSLGDNELTGTIPPELGGLGALTSLALRDNLLTGPLPPELGALRNLRLAWLHRNQLTGPLPASFGNLRNLEWLNVEENALTGPFPHSLLRLRKLELLLVADNDGICVPGVGAFSAWLETHEEQPLCNEADVEGLTALFESTDGGNWTDSRGWLDGPFLERWTGVVTDSAGKVLQLDLESNGLSGRLPSDFGTLLERLKVLRIGGNNLSGPIPPSLAGLQLEELDYADTGLCVPPDESFSAWLEAIPVRRGSLDECPALSDRDILVRLYEATDGESWVDRQNWLTDAPLSDWFGVSVDAKGRVVRIDLVENGLAGRLPPELGRLTGLIELKLPYNQLTGAIPPQLGSLASLERLRLSSNELFGRVPPQLGLLSELRHLDLDNNALAGPIPSEFGGLDALITLSLSRNRLTGQIPPAIGNLSALETLDLAHNLLAGPIPAGLGNLHELRGLSLHKNRLSGLIPSELGRLSQLLSLSLYGNELAGSIPPELRRLASLIDLYLEDNDLTGAIPPELGELANLRDIWLSDNNLAGRIPPQLGMLENARLITLDGNDLTGPLPPEFGNLSGLERLDLSRNAGLGGPLPTVLTELHELQAFDLSGTDFCVAGVGGLANWLEGVGVHRIRRCSSTARAYLTQAVQSREVPVPLVAGEEALLRVFVTARQVNRERIPPVRAIFFVNGREVYSTEIAGRSGPIPTRIDESSLENSVNALVPASIVQPGLEMVIEVDPDGVLDTSLGVERRIPHTGRLALEVAEMPPLDLTLIPFLWTENPDSTIIGTVGAMAADPQNHELLWDTRTLLPVNELRVTAHEPVLTSTNSSWRLFDQTKAIRALEGGQRYYLGMLAGGVRGPAGLAYAPGRVSFSIPDRSVIVHELGHNMSLLHARCGGPKRLDPGFPQFDGSIGAWGYDFRDGRGLVDPLTSDLMSYCDPHWISEYGFSTTLHYRLRTEDTGAAALAASAKSLLLWGGVDTDGAPYLEPAFVVEARPRLPDAGTGYRLEGRDAAGTQLFSLAFDIPAVADGQGAGSFAFVLPVQPGWEDALATLALFGPGGLATLDADSGESVAILLDLGGGQVRGILRDLAVDPRMQADAAGGVPPGRGFQVLFSRGIPDAVEWRR